MLNRSPGERLVSATPPAVWAALQLESSRLKNSPRTHTDSFGKVHECSVYVCMRPSDSSDVQVVSKSIDLHHFLFSFQSDIPPHACCRVLLVISV